MVALEVVLVVLALLVAVDSQINPRIGYEAKNWGNRNQILIANEECISNTFAALWKQSPITQV